MVMEFVPGGELFGHLRAAGRFTVPAARFYTACVVTALNHLHAHDIVYRCFLLELLKLTGILFAKSLGLICLFKAQLQFSA